MKLHVRYCLELTLLGCSSIYLAATRFHYYYYYYGMATSNRRIFRYDSDSDVDELK